MEFDTENIGTNIMSMSLEKGLEAAPRFELGMKVLQTSALPLGYAALKHFRAYKK